MTAPEPDQNGLFQPVIETCEADRDVILVCEHACNAFPAPWGDLGLSGAERQAHIAWDPGALGLMRGLARRLGATTVHATVSRLIYDCNRAPDMAGAMPARSEIHDIPGNTAITPEDRAARTAAVYVPFHDGLHALLMDRIARGLHRLCGRGQRVRVPDTGVDVLRVRHT